MCLSIVTADRVPWNGLTYFVKTSCSCKGRIRNDLHDFINFVFLKRP